VGPSRIDDLPFRWISSYWQQTGIIVAPNVVERDRREWTNASKDWGGQVMNTIYQRLMMCSQRKLRKKLRQSGASCQWLDIQLYLSGNTQQRFQTLLHYRVFTPSNEPPTWRSFLSPIDFLEAHIGKDNASKHTPIMNSHLKKWTLILIYRMVRLPKIYWQGQEDCFAHVE
jgi:hypothetical protein